MPDKVEQFVKLPDIKTVTSLSKTKLYALIKDGDFPAPIKLGRSSVWLMSEVQDWMEKQIAVSRNQEAA